MSFLLSSALTVRLPGGVTRDAIHLENPANNKSNLVKVLMQPSDDVSYGVYWVNKAATTRK